MQTSTSQTEIVGPATFNGQSATEVKSRVQVLTGVGAGSVADSKSYVRIDGLDVLTLGNSSVVLVAGLSATVTSVIDPPSVWRHSLGVGQSLTTTSSITSTTTGIPVPLPATTVSQTYTVKFLGYEDVTVPAGTFAAACKWEVTTASNGATSASTQWISRKGATLKSVSGTEVTELTSGSINGGSVGP
jgi:hypothetical protein